MPSSPESSDEGEYEDREQDLWRQRLEKAISTLTEKSNASEKKVEETRVDLNLMEGYYMTSNRKRRPDCKSLIKLLRRQQQSKQIEEIYHSFSISDWFQDDKRYQGVLAQDWWILVEMEQEAKDPIYHPEVYVGDMIIFPCLTINGDHRKILWKGDKVQGLEIGQEEDGKYVVGPTERGMVKIDRAVFNMARKQITNTLQYTDIRDNVQRIMRNDLLPDLVQTYLSEEDLRAPATQTRAWSLFPRDEPGSSFVHIEILRCHGLGRIPSKIQSLIDEKGLRYLLYPKITRKSNAEGKLRIVDLHGYEHDISVPAKSRKITTALEINNLIRLNPRPSSVALPSSSTKKKLDPHTGQPSEQNKALEERPKTTEEANNQPKHRLTVIKVESDNDGTTIYETENRAKKRANSKLAQKLQAITAERDYHKTRIEEMDGIAKKYTVESIEAIENDNACLKKQLAAAQQDLEAARQQSNSRKRRAEEIQESLESANEERRKLQQKLTDSEKKYEETWKKTDNPQEAIYNPTGPIYNPTGPVYNSTGPIYDPRGAIYGPRGPIYDSV